jgi:hypothetical protein
MGEFKDNSSNEYRWVLTAIDYFTRWVEAIPTKKATKEVVMKFLEEKIITRFGVPATITTDNAKAFSPVALNEFCFKYVLIHTYKRGEVSNPLGVSLEAQCLSPNPLSPRLGLLPSRLTPREAKGGRPYLLCKLINVI